MAERLTRDPKNSMLGGVCAGFAKRYDFDVTLVRIVLVLLTVVTGGIGVPVYIAAWIVMPVEDPSAPSRAASKGPARLGNDVREVSDRLVEAARVLAEKTREAAEEITEIARRAPASSNDASDKNAASVSATVEDRTAAESVPPATMEEDQDLANGRVSDEGLPPIAPASPNSSSSPPSGLPRSMSDQSANPPSPPPQSGATWSPTPAAPPSLPTPPVPPVRPAP